MTGIHGQHSILLRGAAFAAAIVLAAVLAAPANAVTGEYRFDIPGGGNSVPPPLTQPGTAPPASGVPVTPGTTPTTTDGSDGKPKKKKKKNGKKDKKKAKLAELGPAKPSSLAAPVSAVTRGTTPGILPLAAVLAVLLLGAVIGRRVIRKQNA